MTAIPRPKVAFFCMEYGLDASFPIYSGGLGVLAGDILKSAKDLDMPFVGIGILWNEGYSDQYLDERGYPFHSGQDYNRDLLEDTGITVNLWIRGEDVACKVWKVEAFNNVPLYLLDTNFPGSDHGWMTRQLYAGFGQERVAAEMILGIGGIRLLKKIGFDADVYHLNEGHAVFAGLELIRERMSTGKNFHEAWEETRQQIIFTTHTPVMAGNEVHDHSLLSHMGAWAGLEYDQVEEIGGDPFNMTVAGLRLSCLSNGVSELHGSTARAMWKDYHGISPIISITNGVHVKTWQDEQIEQTYNVRGNLWKTHLQAKKRLIEEVQNRTGVSLDLDALTIGFARRAATYKRSGLIFHRPHIIEPLLKDRVIQLVFSGKAHPEDEWGKQIVANIAEMSYRFPDSVVFLENYNMELGKILTTGCDVWLNTPQRPLEASATSGMKAALNGVLNLSVLDGWWPEGCIHGVNGWQFGGGYEGPEQLMVDALSLYEVLLEDVIPTYYDDKKRWQEMMQASIATGMHRFSADRMLTEYNNLMYQPSATMRKVKKDVMSAMAIQSN
ncbi:MAG: alpha-glucan family phosphorylase [Bacillota bacterium]|nr:alpha-glucan family phosphorylase [Bacillota bacterium]HHU61374.1 alpha-glucan family phosphorylase [Natronincola sp.]